eukprot:Hpha_TRINITY_DN16810_c3_g4::TRINITY_DN16810_c3_g4_i1::g.150840::m.150840
MNSDEEEHQLEGRGPEEEAAEREAGSEEGDPLATVLPPWGGERGSGEWAVLPPNPPGPPPRGSWQGESTNAGDSWFGDELTLTSGLNWQPEADFRPRALSVANRLVALRVEVSGIAAAAKDELEEHLQGLLRSTDVVTLPDVTGIERCEVTLGPAERRLVLAKASVVCPGKFATDGVSVSVNGGAWSKPARVLTYEVGALRVELPDIAERFVVPVDDLVEILSSLRCICESAGVVHGIPNKVELFSVAGQRSEDRAREMAIEAARTAIAELNRNAVRLDEAFTVTAEAISDRIRDRAVEAEKQGRFRANAADALAAQRQRLIHATRSLQRRPSLERAWQLTIKEHKQALVDCQGEETKARAVIVRNAGIGLESPLCIEHLERASYTPTWVLCTEGLPKPPVRPRKKVPVDPSEEWLTARAAVFSEREEWWEETMNTFKKKMGLLQKKQDFKTDNLRWQNDPTRWRHPMRSFLSVLTPPKLGPDPRCEVLCCMPCQMARQHEAATSTFFDEAKGPSLGMLACCTAAWLCAPCGGASVAVLYTRTSMRKRYNIREGSRWDMQGVCCWWPFLLVQQWKELRHRGRNPGGMLVKPGAEGEPNLDSIPFGRRVPRLTFAPKASGRVLSVLAGVAVARYIIRGPDDVSPALSPSPAPQMGWGEDEGTSSPPLVTSSPPLGPDEGPDDGPDEGPDEATVEEVDQGSDAEEEKETTPVQSFAGPDIEEME